MATDLCRIEAKASVLKTAWQELALEVTEKCPLTDADARTIVAYMHLHDSVRRVYWHNQKIVDSLPIKLLRFKPAYREAVLRQAAKHAAPVTGGAADDQPLLNAAERDLQKVMRLMAAGMKFNEVEPMMISKIGIFHREQAPEWHSDFIQGAPALAGRIQLPMEYQDVQGQGHLAEDGAVYLIAGGYRDPTDPEAGDVDGTLHRSRPVLRPTPSLFVFQRFPV